MHPQLVLLITVAVFFHALGTLFIPGVGTFYQNVWWWDHLTHVLSSTVVATAGYAFFRAIDEYAPELYFPPVFLFCFLFVITLAFGVVWEIIEFALSGAASLTGSTSVLVQYGVTDTMLDLVFDTAGAFVVAILGTAYLSGLIEWIVARLEANTEE